MSNLFRRRVILRVAKALESQIVPLKNYFLRPDDALATLKNHSEAPKSHLWLASHGLDVPAVLEKIGVGYYFFRAFSGSRPEPR